MLIFFSFLVMLSYPIIHSENQTLSLVFVVAGHLTNVKRYASVMLMRNCVSVHWLNIDTELETRKINQSGINAYSYTVPMWISQSVRTTTLFATGDGTARSQGSSLVVFFPPYYRTLSIPNSSFSNSWKMNNFHLVEVNVTVPIEGKNFAINFDYVSQRYSFSLLIKTS